MPQIAYSHRDPETGQLVVGVRDMTPEEEAERLADEASQGAPVPQIISRRQCAAEMFARSLISSPEAIAMSTTGTPPTMVETMLAAMPEPMQTYARIDFGAPNYDRANPLLVALMSGTGADAEAIDQFFRDAASR